MTAIVEVIPAYAGLKCALEKNIKLLAGYLFRRNRRCPPDILMPTSPDTFQHFILISCE